MGICRVLAIMFICCVCSSYPIIVFLCVHAKYLDGMALCSRFNLWLSWNCLFFVADGVNFEVSNDMGVWKKVLHGGWGYNTNFGLVRLIL